MNEEKIEAFAERLFTEVNGAMSCLSLYLGYRLGLFKALQESGPVTAEKLAAATGFQERYVREWLGAMAAGDYVEYDAASTRFTLPEEHAACLLSEDHGAYALPFVAFIPSFARILDPLMEAFRSGGGVPYEAYGEDCRVDGIGMGNRPMYVNDYASKWIPAMPDVESRLSQGGRVVEVGCGMGWSSISLAKGFPNVRIDGIDPDEESIAGATEIARREGVAERVTFHHAPVEDTHLEGPYDLVTAFECIHDMPYPVRALSRMRELAGADGTVLIADEAIEDKLEDNRNFMGHLMYNFSLLHCLPQAMVFPGAAGTGTVMGPGTLKKYADEAGFSAFQVLEIENPLWRFYRLTP